MILALDHIGIAVKDLEAAKAIWSSVLGAVFVHQEDVADQRVRVAVFTLGSLRVELLEATSDDSPMAKFVAARGPGIHHIALQSDDVRTELERLNRMGTRLIDSAPRIGAAGTLVAFLHPQALDGVLVEIVERPR